MTELKVFEGGRDKQYQDKIMAQYLFREFAIELLRVLGGGSNLHRVWQVLGDFARHCGHHDIDIRPVIEEAIKDIREEAFERDAISYVDPDVQDVIDAAMKVFAESLALDGAAKGRVAQRSRKLTEMIEAEMLHRETRSRKAGWSYLSKLAERIGPWKERQKTESRRVRHKSSQ